MLPDKLLMYACVGLSLAILVMGGVWWMQVAYLTNQIGELENERDRLKLQLSTAIDSNKRMAAEIGIQNSAVLRWKQEMFQRETIAAAALQAARAETKRWEKKYDSLFNRPPANPSDLLTSISLRMDEYLTLREEK